MLASGEVLVTGGNLVIRTSTPTTRTRTAGLNRVFTFDPWTREWTEQPQMNDGRWYPGQVLLADGRTVASADTRMNLPAASSTATSRCSRPPRSPAELARFRLSGLGPAHTGLYPHLFALPN